VIEAVVAGIFEVFLDLNIQFFVGEFVIPEIQSRRVLVLFSESCRFSFVRESGVVVVFHGRGVAATAFTINRLNDIPDLLGCSFEVEGANFFVPCFGFFFFDGFSAVLGGFIPISFFDRISRVFFNLFAGEFAGFDSLGTSFVPEDFSLWFAFRWDAVFGSYVDSGGDDFVLFVDIVSIDGVVFLELGLELHPVGFLEVESFVLGFGVVFLLFAKADGDENGEMLGASCVEGFPTASVRKRRVAKRDVRSAFSAMSPG